MPELLFELGVEELPASAVRRAKDQLAQEITQRLTEATLTFGEVVSLGTPRRLIVCVRDVQDRQADSTKDVRGPGLKAAFDAEGKPTQALLGFCRGQGVDPSTVRPDGDYVWVRKEVPGRATIELLAEILPEAVKSLTFDKTMRWGQNRMRFARPIRWMLASFGGACVPFSIEGIESGLESRGHRFNFPEPFAAPNLDSLFRELRNRQVEPDPVVRERKIREEAISVASGVPDLKDELVDENVFLTEWPTALEGQFGEEFLVLPDPVLETAMAKHERFFPIRDAQGQLTNRFISIRNGGVDEVVRTGNAWVLNARFNDAKFFFDEDKKSTLDDFLAKTERMLFQEKLGSVRKRADRLSALCGFIAESTGGNADEIAWARQAGLYAKADLSTGLVSELASLQGVIGGEYARREGFPAAVCEALACQYDLGRLKDRSSIEARTAVRLQVADQMDKLVGYLGQGLEPSGSSDPFGLRRGVTLLIECAWAWDGKWPRFFDFVPKAVELYAEQGIALDAEAIRKSLDAIFKGRYESMMSQVRYDLRLAACAEGEMASLDDPRGIRLRVEALELIGRDVALVQTMTRPFNIVQAALKKGSFTMPNLGIEAMLTGLEPGRLDSAESVTLLKAAQKTCPVMLGARSTEDAKALAKEVQGLVEPINRFFDSTMVMADDPVVREARLTLVSAVMRLLSLVGDFTEIVLEERAEPVSA